MPDYGPIHMRPSRELSFKTGIINDYYDDKATNNVIIMTRQ